MKFKQQEETKTNSFLDSIIHLMCINLEFNYAIKSQVDFAGMSTHEFTTYTSRLHGDQEWLNKLFIAINPEHKPAELNPTLKPVDSVKELVKLEEEYYNILKEIGKNALEQNEFEVVAYLSNIIIGFKHYFCTLDEGNVSGETGS